MSYKLPDLLFHSFLYSIFLTLKTFVRVLLELFLPLKY